MKLKVLNIDGSKGSTDNLDDTVFVITTDYALVPKRQRASHDVWMASSFKTFRFGMQENIMPSILHYFDIDVSGQDILN